MTARRFVRLPPFGAGQTIGLLGGSFNPPHEGHRHISELALKRLGLDRLWWVVTPGNPLSRPKSAHIRYWRRGGDWIAVHL